MVKQTIKIVQLGTVPLARLLFLLVIKRKVIALESSDISDAYRYVIVANHSGAPDGLIICYSIDFSISRQLAPYRFFTKNSLFRNWLLRPILNLFGCFRARKEMGKNGGLNFGIRLLNDRQNLVIFPEGKVSRLDRRVLPRTGVETLANREDVKLIPARVKWNRNKGLIKSYSLAIGKPFDGKNMTAEQIMDVVYGLKFR